MMAPKLTIAERLLAAQVAIENALGDADIRAALSAFGYDEARLRAGKALYEEAVALANRQKAEYGDQYGGTDAVKSAWAEADRAYRVALQVARVAFKGYPKAHAALMLDGERKRSLPGWLEQAAAFYANLLGDADLLARMGNFGYTSAKLEAEHALVQAVAAANLAQEKEKGEAQDATRQRDARLDELDAWMADFKAIAQAAMAENPEWLEKLGWRG
jgi:hypothetical protein